MASSALDWCSLDRLKHHLNMYRDASGNFVGTEQDVKLIDCIEGAVKWCAQYTRLPLLETDVHIRFQPAPDRTEPVVLKNLLYPVNITSGRWWSIDDPRRLKRASALDEIPVVGGRQWEPVYDNQGLSDISSVVKVFPPGDEWPDASIVELTFKTKVPVQDNPQITNAVILVAKDLYDGPSVMERRTAAEHLLLRFRSEWAPVAKVDVVVQSFRGPGFLYNGETI